MWGIFASWVIHDTTGLYITSYLFHLSAILSPVFWTVYFLSRVELKKLWKRVFVSFTCLLTLVQLIMLVCNIPTHFMFYVDAQDM